MANRVTIDVEAKFHDNASSGIDKVQKKADKLGKTNINPKINADDKASSKFSKVMGAAAKFGGKVFKGTVDIADKATSKIEKVMGAAARFTRKVISVPIKVIDKASSVLTGIKNKIFSLETAFKALIAGFAAKKLVLDPINLADAYSGAKIGFSTLLGDTAGQEMMNKIDKFAKETPFKTAGVISNVQKMMAYGWDVDRVIDDMKTIGDAAAATGKGDEGLTSIVYALSEIRSKGKLSTQELNQLASAGIKAKQYLAQGLGYGTDDTGLKKLSEDLEDGAIGANQAIELILQGMKEFDGMMDRTANETVEGLKSQLEDTFEINIFRRWGQGLQDGAKRGMGSIVSLLDDADNALTNFGDTVYEVGRKISNFLADKLETTIGRITDITSTYEFKTASLSEKIKMLWNGVIADPISNWWETKGHDLAMEKAADFGTWLGNGLTNGIEAISNGILYMLGIDTGEAEKSGNTIGSSFWDAFTEAFDSGRVTDAISAAIEGVWSRIPTWAKVLIGVYAGGKAISGIGRVVGGISNIAGGIGTFYGGAKAFIGTPGTTMMQGTGMLNLLANTGYLVSGGVAASGLTPGMAALIGGGTIAGGLSAGAGLIHTGVSAYKAYKAYKAGDKVEGDAQASQAITAGGGLATGIAIGSLFGIPGMIIGGGIGAAAGIFMGKKMAKEIRETAYAIDETTLSTNEAKEAAAAYNKEIGDTGKVSEETAQKMNEAWAKELYLDMNKRFGEIKLSAAEIETMAKRITFGDKIDEMEQYATATANAKASLQTMENTVYDLKKWNWKMGLGIELSQDDLKSVKQSVDSYISAAMSYIENEHYSFTMAASIIFDPESEQGKSFIELGNSIFTPMQEELSSIEKEFNSAWEQYFSDGISKDVEIEIDGKVMNEQEYYESLVNRVTEITNKIAKSRQKVELEMIDFKYSDMTFDSWENLKSELDKQLNSGKATNESAAADLLVTLDLKLNDAQTEEEKAEIEKKIQEVKNGLDLQDIELETNISSMAFNLMDDVWSKDLKGATSTIQEAINTSISEGLSPKEWSREDVSRLLGISNLEPHVADEIIEFSQWIVEMFPKTYKVDTEVDPKVTLVKESEERTKRLFEDRLGGNQTVNPMLTLIPEVEAPNTIPWYSNVEDKTEYPYVNIYGQVIDNTSPWVHYEPDQTLFPNLYINGKLNDRTPAWNPSVADQTVRPTLTIDPIVRYNSIKNFADNYSNSLLPGPRATKKANGGFVGSKILSWLGEEGYPEMVIPFAPHRRQRALELYEQTGKMLGVSEHANGGMVGGENVPIISSGSGNSGQSIEVNVEGITIQVSGSGGSISDDLESQKAEIAEKVSEILYKAFSGQFGNTPARA